MTQWHIIHGDILDANADGLICSANPSLNLSGGVGGAFALRYGDAMQKFLHDYLDSLSLRTLTPGAAVIAPSCDSPFRAVAHAVAIDEFYDTKAEWIYLAYKTAIDGLISAGCHSVVSACLACGYGRYAPDQFANAIRPLLTSPFAELETLTFVSTNKDVCLAVASLLSNNPFPAA